MSAPDLFKFEHIWCKSRAADFVHANNRPLWFHENIVLFSEGAPASRSARRMPYFPRETDEDGFPRSLLYFPADPATLHPMQKPVALLRWLIELYSRPGDVVLDSCMGSGSTRVAAIETGRSFIGFEQHEPHYETAAQRLSPSSCR